MQDLRIEPILPEILEERARILSQRAGTFVDFHESLIQYPHLLFRSGEESFAIALKSIIEVVADPQVTRVPGTPQALAGVINLRGVIIDIVHLEVLLHISSQALREKKHILICQVKEKSFGLWISHVIKIISILPETVKEPHDYMQKKIRNHFTGVSQIGKENKEIVPILNLESLFNSSDFDAVRKQK